MAKRDDPQFRIRLPADLKKRIEESAKASGRSLNTEIEKRLDFTFSVFGKGFAPSPEEIQNSLSQAMEELRIAQEAQKEANKESVDPVERAIARYEVKRAREKILYYKHKLREVLSVTEFMSNHSRNREIYKRILGHIEIEDEEE